MARAADRRSDRTAALPPPGDGGGTSSGRRGAEQSEEKSRIAYPRRAPVSSRAGAVASLFPCSYAGPHAIRHYGYVAMGTVFALAVRSRRWGISRGLASGEDQQL